MLDTRIVTKEKVVKEIWAMIDAHDGPAQFDDTRHVAQNIATRLGAPLLMCEVITEAMENDMLKAGMLKEGW